MSLNKILVAILLCLFPKLHIKHHNLQKILQTMSALSKCQFEFSKLAIVANQYVLLQDYTIIEIKKMNVPNCQYAHRLPQHQMKKVNNFLFDLFDQIGSGYSSKVYKGKNCVNESLVAIKVVQLAKLNNEVEKRLLANESRALNIINHPNILRAIHTMQTINNFYLVTELYEQNLQQFLKGNGPFNEQQTISFLIQMIDALAYLQSSNIVHRDVKPSNIFISQGNYVLGDFGFCQFTNSTCHQRGFNVGSPMYMSPQAYKSSIYGSKSDVWALGICVLELLNGGRPFSQMTYDQMVLQIHEGKLLKSFNISQKLKQLVSFMLELKYEKRISPVDLQKLLLDSENNQIPSIHIPNFSMQISPSQNRNNLKNNHRRSASVRFIQNQKQIKFKNSNKRKGSPAGSHVNQQNILQPIAEKKPCKSITVINPPLTERSNHSHQRQISFNEASRPPPNPKIIVLEDLSKLLLLDSFLCENFHKLKLLRFLSIVPSVRIPGYVKSKIDQIPPDYYLNYIIQTIDFTRIFEVSHFLTFLLHNALIQYTNQDISRKVSDQNFCNRVNCLQHALKLWGVIRQTQQTSRPCSIIAEPKILDRAKSKSTGNLMCNFVFGKNQQIK